MLESRRQAKDLAEEKRMDLLKDVDPNYVDTLLSNELRQMNFKERDEMQEELHGVRTLAKEETPEMIQKSMRRLEKELRNIPRKEAYDEAQQHPNTYVNTRAFRLKFLRAEVFDEKATAARIVLFLDMMKEYYGAEALLRPPRMSDLGKAEMELLKAGGEQILPSCDRSGRRIMVFIGAHGKGYSVYSRIKLDLFFAWCISEDEQTQKNGAAFLTWATAETIEVVGDQEDRPESERLFMAAPTRMVACHICIPPEPIFRFLSSLMLLILGRDGRRMTRIHCGMPLELIYSLMAFGIPADQIPVTSTGTVKTKNHLQWMKFVKEKEKAERQGVEFDGIEYPRVYDVLFSLGSHTWSHPGYAMFRALLEEYYDRHSAASSLDEKLSITWEVVERVEKRGGRFLTRDKRGWWVEIKDRGVIRGKVALAFRNHTKRVVAQRNVQETESTAVPFLMNEKPNEERAMMEIAVVEPVAAQRCSRRIDRFENLL